MPQQLPKMLQVVRVICHFAPWITLNVNLKLAQIFNFQLIYNVEMQFQLPNVHPMVKFVMIEVLVTVQQHKQHAQQT